MRGISGCPVNPPIDVVTIAALAPRMWVAKLLIVSLALKRAETAFLNQTVTDGRSAASLSVRFVRLVSREQ